MKIKRFWAKGYRSLRDVRLEGLGPLNVFYGPNGSGKSNLLDAMRTLHRLAGLLLRPRDEKEFGEGAWNPQSFFSEEFAAAMGPKAQEEAILSETDATVFEESGVITLGAEWDLSQTAAVVKTVGCTRLCAEVVFKQPLRGLLPTLRFSRFDLDEGTGTWAVSPAPVQRDEYRQYATRGMVLGHILASQAFDMVDAIRNLKGLDEVSAPPENVDPVRWSLESGRTKVALFLASTSPQHQTRKHLARFRTFLEGPPLHRPPFVAVQDPVNKRVDVREPHPRGGDVSLDMAGLGIAQVYGVLARVLLSGARMVALEEPEAHLYGPQSGLYLRELLLRAVREEYVDQLFIATHSSLFDLDDSGFFEVRLENSETVVTRKPLDAIDVHLFEPGPTLRAFEELLSLGSGDKVMYRRTDGTPLTTREMLALLRADDPVALEYLKDLHRAAVDVIGLRARRKEPR